ncbi:MlaD family protein [Ferrimonas aestuarii]|uniref:MCE family protein n=1 Tax=Ferrimonas aestuarii TaxID=2569539 RepID=A0A4V5NWG3_9GAMM|nr:MlaD family protein [Ferrimonas aestuarii]TKB57492.1 MCE family protein [Ferrimonas aestuarii]
MSELESARIKRKKLISPIWILPFLAAVLGAWLLVSYVKQQGTDITIHFPDANGIEANKTLVRYQGVNVGTVHDVSLNDTDDGVVVSVKMEHTVSHLLNRDTQFWLVSPKASLAGVEGLDTLFSGNYIAMKPGQGEPRLEFTADTMAPTSEDGATIFQLTTMASNHLNAGSGVYFQQVKVGSILQTKLDPTTQSVRITAQVDEEYRSLLKQQSRFWSVSGVQAKASLDGISIEMESLAALLTGGVAFDSPTNSEVATSGSQFPLFENRGQAYGGVGFTLSAPSATGLKVGSDIRWQGVNVGEIDGISAKSDGVTLEATLFDGYQHLLKQGSQFWQVKAQIGLTKVKAPANLLFGDHIDMLAGNGDDNYQFELAQQPPRPGILITATHPTAKGLTSGSLIYYRGLVAGEVKSVSLGKEDVRFTLLIDDEFSPLIGANSKFWIQSGAAIKADLSKISIETAPVSQLIAPSITFSASEVAQKPTQAVTLFDNEKHATDAEPLWLKLTADSADNLSVGSPVYFKQLEVGQIRSLRADKDQVTVRISIDDGYRHLYQPQSRFWKYSGVRIEGSLNNFSVDTPPIMGLMRGGLSFANLDDSSARTNKWVFDSQSEALADVSRFTIVFPASAEIAKGAPVKFHQQPLGSVERIRFSDDLSQLIATVAIDQRWASHFQVEGAKYYVAKAELGLTNTKNLSNLVFGNFIAALPSTGNLKSQFHAIDTVTDAIGRTGSRRVTLTKSTLGSIKIGSPILYRQLQVGQVIGHRLAPQADKVEIQIEVWSNYEHLLNGSSRFWNASGLSVKLGLFSGAEIHTESLDTLLMGGIAFATKDATNDDNQIQPGQQFRLHQKSKPEWLKWDSPL